MSDELDKLRWYVASLTPVGRERLEGSRAGLEEAMNLEVEGTSRASSRG